MQHISKEENTMLSSVMQRLNDRRDGAADLGEDAGFTLIELMVVLLILAILLAIAIPTFLGVTGGANDRAAQSNLNTGLTTAKAAESQNANQTYTGVTAGTLHLAEPSIDFVTGAVTATGQVSVYVDATSQNGVVLASWSPANSGTCWYASDNVGNVGDTGGPYTVGSTNTPPALTPGTQYGKGATGVAKTACTANAPLTGVTWANGFPS
jgi:type IV pilus assembly protein PilA